jgi:hypothetical protein
MDVIISKLYARNFQAFKSKSHLSAGYLNRNKCSGIEEQMYYSQQKNTNYSAKIYNVIDISDTKAGYRPQHWKMTQPSPPYIAANVCHPRQMHGLCAV